MDDLSKLKVAIVCDWLVGIGGAERVVLELHKMFPAAPIYTSQYAPSEIDWFKNADVRTTWLQHVPKALRKFLPVLRAWTFSRLDLSNYDLVVSATGAEAKAVKTGVNTTHICYCFAPTHYYWSRYDAYIQSPGFGHLDWLARFGLKMLVGPMRRWDCRAAQRPDYLIGISTHIQKEIKKYYGRDSSLIFPPVDIERFKSEAKVARHGFVIAGRQTPYKRFDLAIAACTTLNLPLLVLGNGPEHQKLQRIAGPSVTFIDIPSDEEVATDLKKAEAFIFPGLDDFGIVAVEAMAAGTPVIAYKGGGALDYIIPGQTGEFFDIESVDGLKKALENFNSQTYKPTDLVNQAKKFSPHVFQENLRKIIEQSINQQHAE